MSIARGGIFHRLFFQQSARTRDNNFDSTPKSETESRLIGDVINLVDQKLTSCQSERRKSARIHLANDQVSFIGILRPNGEGPSFGRSKIFAKIKQDVDAVAFLITDRVRLSTLLIADDHGAGSLSTCDR